MSESVDDESQFSGTRTDFTDGGGRIQPLLHQAPELVAEELIDLLAGSADFHYCMVIIFRRQRPLLLLV